MQLIFVVLLAIASAGLTFVLMWSGFKGSEKHPLTPLFGGFATVMWFISGASSTVIHRPYTHVVENTADNSMTVIEEGVQKITVNWPLTEFFWALGLFCLALTFILYFEEIKGWLSGGAGYGGRGGY